MNRPIKFRVWDISERRFLDTGEGLFFQSKNSSFSSEIGSFLLNLKNWSFIIEQFTGLLDLNSKEIYEGDILSRRGETKKVTFWSGDDYDFQGFDVEQVFGKWEVIGNIHENQNLIEK